MPLSFRSEPHRSLAAWFLGILTWLSLAATGVNSPSSGQSAQQPPEYLVRRAEITLSVADAERTATELEELARTVRGHLGGFRTRVYVSSGHREVSATLLLPPEMLDTALARLRGMALAVEGEEAESRDVSRQVAELTRRLEELRATRRRVENLVERAETDSERYQVEAELSDAEAQIATAEAALLELRQEADWAVIRILAVEIPPTPTASPTPTPSPTPTATLIPVTPSPTPWHPDETVRRATDTLVSIVRQLADVLIVVTILGGPFLVLALVGWWIVGRLRS